MLWKRSCWDWYSFPGGNGFFSGPLSPDGVCQFFDSEMGTKYQRNGGTQHEDWTKGTADYSKINCLFQCFLEQNKEGIVDWFPVFLFSDFQYALHNVTSIGEGINFIKNSRLGLKFTTRIIREYTIPPLLTHFSLQIDIYNAQKSQRFYYQKFSHIHIAWFE